MSPFIRKQIFLQMLVILLIIVSSMHTLHAFNDTTTAMDLSAITVRLVGKNKHQGLLEVHLDGQWGAICDANFDNDEAEVACRQLGYDRAEKYITDAATRYDLSSRELILFDGLDCDGHESSFGECYYKYRVDTSCLSGYNVAGVECDDMSENPKDMLNDHFNLLGWGVFFGFLMVGFALAGRRYRQRMYRSNAGSGLQSNTVSATVYANGMPIPPPSNASYPALRPDSYPTQPQQPFQNNLQTTSNLSEQVNSELQPGDGTPILASAWSQPGHYVPQTHNNMAYQQPNGVFYQPASSNQYFNATPYPSASAPGFPPYTNDYTPSMPPPSYESISADSDQRKNNTTET